MHLGLVFPRGNFLCHQFQSLPIIVGSEHSIPFSIVNWQSYFWKNGEQDFACSDPFDVSPFILSPLKSVKEVWGYFQNIFRNFKKCTASDRIVTVYISSVSAWKSTLHALKLWFAPFFCARWVVWTHKTLNYWWQRKICLKSEPSFSHPLESFINENPF